MDPSLIDKALDMRLVLSYNGNLPIAEFSRNRAMSFQAGLMLGEKTVDISCFIPDDLEQNREVSIFLAQNELKRLNRNFILNFSFDEPVIFNALANIVKLFNSVVIDNLVLANGVYYLSFRFHSSELNKISGTIIKYSSEVERIGIDYLGANPGIGHIAKEAKSLTSLVSVSMEMTPPKEFMDTGQMKILGSEWSSEARYMSSTNSFSQIVLTKDSISEPEKHGINVIDAKGNLYEMNIKIPLLGHYFQKCYDSRIIRIRRTLNYNEGKMFASIIVPEITSADLLRVIADTRAKYTDWNLFISEYRHLQE